MLEITWHLQLFTSNCFQPASNNLSVLRYWGEDKAIQMWCPSFELSLRCVLLFNSPSSHSPARCSSHVWDLAIGFVQNDVWLMFFIPNLSHWCWWVLHILFFFQCSKFNSSKPVHRAFQAGLLIAGLDLAHCNGGCPAVGAGLVPAHLHPDACGSRTTWDWAVSYLWSSPAEPACSIML